MRAMTGALLLAALAAPALAQTPKEALQEDWDRSRQNLLAYADAMPVEGLRFRPTEGVRDFAEQIEHAAVGNVGIFASVLGIPREQRKPLGDPEVYLNDKTALKAMVTAAYDYVDELMAGLTAEDLNREVRLFGQVPVPLWKAIELAQEHATWTLGETVPYLRLNGATPPAYALVPAM